MAAHLVVAENPAPPDLELLWRTARPDEDPANDARLGELLRGGPDWAFLLAQAQSHGTLPLLQAHLRRLRWCAVPEPVRLSLQDAFRRNAAFNLGRADELVRLLARFRARGIPVLPFKGPTLALYAYGGLAWRQFHDLDLLLRPTHLRIGAELLGAAGYVPHPGLPRACHAAYCRALGQTPYFRGQDQSLVELHAHLAPRHFHLPLELEELWTRREALLLQGQEVPVASAEDLLVILAAHGGKHLFACLGWVSDVAALLLRRPPLDLELALARARRLRAERLVLLALRLGYALLERAPPANVSGRWRSDPAVRWLAERVGRWWREDALPGGFQQALFHLQSRECFHDGLTYALSLALSPTVADWQLLALPPAFSFLYYGLRPLRLAGKYGRRLLGRRR